MPSLEKPCRRVITLLCLQISIFPAQKNIGV
jgi:hypothetical protein